MTKIKPLAYNEPIKAWKVLFKLKDGRMVSIYTHLRVVRDSKNITDYFYKDGRNVDVISESEIQIPFGSIGTTLRTIPYGMHSFESYDYACQFANWVLVGAFMRRYQYDFPNTKIVDTDVVSSVVVPVTIPVGLSISEGLHNDTKDASRGFLSPEMIMDINNISAEYPMREFTRSEIHEIGMQVIQD